jgi:hypothetical protein
MHRCYRSRFHMSLSRSGLAVCALLVSLPAIAQNFRIAEVGRQALKGRTEEGPSTSPHRRRRLSTKLKKKAKNTSVRGARRMAGFAITS